MNNQSSRKHSLEVQEDHSRRPELSRTFTFWYSYQKLSREAYENEIKKLGSFSTIENFWTYYQHMVRPDKLPVGGKFALFQEGIKPAWEDKENQGGGSFTLRVKKEYSNKFWEDLLISFIGEQCDDTEAICGIFLNSKPNEINISIWTKALDDESKGMVEEWLRKTLGFNENIRLDFRYHPKTTTEEPHAHQHAHSHQKQQGPKRFERNEDFRKKQETETKI